MTTTNADRPMVAMETTSVERRRRGTAARRRRWSIITAATLASCAAMTAASGAATATPVPRAEAGAERASIAGSNSTARLLPAVVRPGRDVTLAAPLDGRLGTVLVEEGERVEANEVLARMDDGVARASVELARVEAGNAATVRRAKAELGLALKQLARLERSAASQAATANELDEARTAVERSEAALQDAEQRLETARARLTLEEARLEEHAVRAPFDGVVLRVDAEVGAALNLAEPILRVVSLDELEADLHLPAAMIGSLEAGDVVTLAADKPVGVAIQATVASAEPLIDTASGTFRCVVKIENPGAALPAGFLVRLGDAERSRITARATLRQAATARSGHERASASTQTD